MLETIASKAVFISTVDFSSQTSSSRFPRMLRKWKRKREKEEGERIERKERARDRAWTCFQSKHINDRLFRVCTGCPESRAFSLKAGLTGEEQRLLSYESITVPTKLALTAVPVQEQGSLIWTRARMNKESLFPEDSIVIPVLQFNVEYLS